MPVGGAGGSHGDVYTLFCNDDLKTLSPQAQKDKTFTLFLFPGAIPKCCGSVKLLYCEKTTAHEFYRVGGHFGGGISVFHSVANPSLRRCFSPVRISSSSLRSTPLVFQDRCFVGLCQRANKTSSFGISVPACREAVTNSQEPNGVTARFVGMGLVS